MKYLLVQSLFFIFRVAAVLVKSELLVLTILLSLGIPPFHA